ncbi:hypothetical protein ACIRD2_01880 [Streptomyces sp. NPDC093595]|uniref:hypothetical protein n=1 Tax=Streptomyces sp. NPDC093595 TaxID=3366045 RepID=UPI00380E9128
MTKFIASRGQWESESGREFGLAELRGDSARMVRHWVVPAEEAPAPVPPSLIHGVVVPPASARLIASTAEYGT